MIIACARRSGQDVARARSAAALLEARSARPARTAWRSRARGLLLVALWWVGWRDVAGEPAQSVTYGIDHPGGTIAIHDRAPSLHLGPRLSAAALSAARELPERLGVGLPSAVAVVVAGDAHTFAAAAGRDPRWLLGVARPEAGLAVLNAARLGPGPEVAAEAVLRHELAHLALAEAEAKSGPLPQWFNEGAASWFAGGTAEQGPIDLALAAAAPGLSLSELGPSFPEDPRAAAQAYAKSQLAVALIARRIKERGGAENLRPLGAALSSGSGFEAALLTTTGWDGPGLEAELRKRLLRHELGGALLRQAEWGLGLAMAVLVGIAYLRYRLRLKRRLARWGREEGEMPEDRGEGEGSSGEREPS